MLRLEQALQHPLEREREREKDEGGGWRVVLQQANHLHNTVNLTSSNQNRIT